MKRRLTLGIACICMFLSCSQTEIDDEQSNDLKQQIEKLQQQNMELHQEINTLQTERDSLEYIIERVRQRLAIS